MTLEEAKQLAQQAGATHGVCGPCRSSTLFYGDTLLRFVELIIETIRARGEDK